MPQRKRIWRLGHDLLHFLVPGWLDKMPNNALRDEMRQAGLALIHIPKCAGNSVANRLYRRAPSHRTWRWYQGIGVPTIAVVRDPVERFISAYDFLRGGGITNADRLFARLHVTDDINLFARRLEQSRRIRSYYHFQEQGRYVLDGSRLAVDEIVAIEHLARRFPDIAAVNRTGGPRTDRSELTAASIRLLEQVYRKDILLHRLALREPGNVRGMVLEA